jgi:subtilisin family serine protease
VKELFVKINSKFRPTWGRALLLLPALAALGSCTDRDPIRPEAITPLPSVAASASMERGCARFEVRLSGKDRIQVVPDTSVRCGPVQPVLSGEPAFDVTRKLVRLPVALENRGQRKLKAPARLYAWEDSLAVVSPVGLSGNGHSASYLGIVSPDSTGSGAGAVLAWRYDEQLPGAARVLGAGERSGVRWIEVSVQPGVEALRVTFRGSAIRASRPIPAEVPDTIPDGLYGNFDQILWNSPYFGLSDKVLKNVVSIRFEKGTAQAVRQAAVDAVGGELIGGQPIPGIEGYYLIHVADDGTGKQMSEAIDRLNGLPGVAAAEPEYLFDQGERDLWLKPKDDGGGDWSNEWQLDPVKADGKNWALEAIAAPMAWGCSTGDRGTKVAVIDAGFLSHPDLMPNVIYAPEIDRFSGLVRKNDHGTRVASIIGAKGNNGQGITGVMWDAGLMLMEHSNSPASIFEDLIGRLKLNFTGPLPDVKLQRIQMTHALALGANVVNLSVGTQGKWKRTDLPVEALIAQNQKDVDEMKAVLDASNNKALVVVAAGNEHKDAAWTGYPILAAMLPQQVIAVSSINSIEENGAIERGNAFNDFDSPFPREHRNLIQIYAPGRDVPGLADGVLGNWKIASMSGTSAAAPIVAGVAGLLKSFDPTLTTAEIKNLLIEGSKRGGKPVRANVDGTKLYLVNAYESLKLAAQRPGAPLCGNHLWASFGKLVAGRGTEQEVLFTGSSLYSIDARHGGWRIRTTGYEYNFLRNGTWSVSPSAHPSVTRGSGGTHLSINGYSHNLDSTVVLQARSVSESKVAFDVKIRTAGGEKVLQTIERPVQNPSEQRVCVWDDPSIDMTCHWYHPVFTDKERIAGWVAYSPTGDEIVLTLTQLFTSSWVGQHSICPWADERDVQMCAPVFGSRRTGDTEVYAIRISDGSYRKLWTLPGGGLSRVGIAEDGTELVAKHDFEHITAIGEWGEVPYPVWRTLEQTRRCDVDFRELRTGRLLRKVAVCDSGPEYTISP